MLNYWLQGTSSLFERRNTFPEPRRKWEIPALLFIVVLAAAIRFWGLGNVGLHDPDEDTMALPTIHIVEEGTPYFPSGMFYVRAYPQLYAMAGSVQVFGESEWAFRFPSVIAGLALVVLAYFMGRRFLDPVWNMAFVCAVAFLPEFVFHSQTARMYIFYVACIAACSIFIFRWEYSDRLRDLAAAVAALVVGIQFQVLAVFAAFLLFYPAILQGERRKLLWAAISFATVVAAFLATDLWVSQFYPASPEGYGTSAVTGEGQPELTVNGVVVLLGVAAMLAMATAAWAVVKQVQSGWARWATAAALGAGIVAQSLLQYHLAVVFIAAGVLLASRTGRQRASSLVVLGGLSLAVLLAHFTYALTTGEFGSVREALGSLVGFPSVWPYLRSGQHAPAALLLVGLGAVVAFFRLVQRKSIPDYWLFFVLGFVGPLFLIGCFQWNVPLRYTVGTVLGLLIPAFALCQEYVRKLAGERHAVHLLGASLIVVAVVNPVALFRVTPPQYGPNYADHKGAAEFVRSLDIGPEDVVIAEEVLTQTYYLGSVDYWLMASNVLRGWVEEVDGEIRDIYTGSRVLGNGPDFQGLINDPERGALYVIGSGEQQANNRLTMRGPEIQRIMNSDVLELLYEGRDDGLTKVWRISEGERLALDFQ